MLDAKRVGGTERVLRSQRKIRDRYYMDIEEWQEKITEISVEFDFHTLFLPVWN